ncbi:MAG: hypothetical protein JNM30_09925 [Rhodospirillales bacterium]|nr:hypothetical protein [Rhodospirillales bacterium]
MSGRSKSSTTADDPSNGKNAKGKAASSLGNLNAAHASPTGLANAAPNSVPGQLNAYSEAMKSALSIEDPASRDKAIAAARSQLSQTANKSLSTQDIGLVDSMLGIKSAEAEMAGVGRN